MNDPLDAVFVTGAKSAELKRAKTVRELATYLERMPAELRAMFSDQFQHITSAELAQLRATVEEQARQLAEARKALIAWRICELNENGDDIFTLMESIDEVELYESGEGLEPWAYGLRDAWLAANPAPQEDAKQ